MTGLQPLASDARIRERARRAFGVVAGPGQHGAGAVVRGDRQSGIFRSTLLDLVRVGEDRNHAAACGQRPEEAATFCDQPRAIVETEDARRHRLPRTGRRCARTRHRAECPTTATTGQAPSPRRTARVGQRWCCVTPLRCPAPVSNSTSSKGRASTRRARRRIAVIGLAEDRLGYRTTSVPFPGTGCPDPETATLSSADHRSYPASGPVPDDPRWSARSRRRARRARVHHQGRAVLEVRTSGSRRGADVVEHHIRVLSPASLDIETPTTSGPLVYVPTVAAA